MKQVQSKLGLSVALRRAGLLLGTASVAMGFGLQPAVAQTASAPAAEASEKVTVTGSRIRRNVATAPSPLIQVTGQELLQSGQPNIVDYLADVPALSGSQVPEDTTGANLNDGGLSLLNLRDLGAVRTLVLVDGRRHVGSNPGTLSVDVDTIPSALIQSVEVITGGQSALYGADAVSGVVNFILKKNFEGIQADATYGQINQDGQASQRYSVLVGHNFFDDKLNVYAFAEHQTFEEVLDFDIDYRRRAYALTGNDADPAATPVDADLDNIIFSNRRDARFARGGTIILSNQPQPSATNDPDTGNFACGAVPVNPYAVSISSNCTAIRADLASKVFTFNAAGVAQPLNFGTAQPQTGFSRPLTINGDGLNTGTEFGQGSRVPESDANRFQAGLNFQILPTVGFFAEAKYVEETTFDSGQPTFFSLTLAPFTPLASANGSLLGWNGVGDRALNTFSLGLDNAFLNASSPALVAAILANTRPSFNPPTAGAPGTVNNPAIADARAFMNIFGPSRSQLNERDLQRYVVGFRGEEESFLGLSNFSWEIGYTYGEMNNSNKERGLDGERFFYAIDSVVDVANVTGKGAGATVCRVQLLAAQGVAIANRSNTGTLSPTDPSVVNCTPTSIFGTDFRSDANHPNATGGGGRTGLTAAQATYILAEIEVTNQNKQENFLAFASGDLWDLWGAGEIGVAAGYEYRKETTSGTGRDRDTAGRLLFLNTGPDFLEKSYDVKEFFGEIRIPLIRDVLGADLLEISGAYRKSDYSTIGETEAFSVQGGWKVSNELFIRATAGTSTRVPNLGENFAPASQTFGNGLIDPCSPDGIRAQAALTAAQRNQLRANCVAALPAGYDPGTDTPGTGSPLQIQYTSGIPGFNQGNINLKAEEGSSFTYGFALTPDLIPNFTVTADYYNIEITEAIAAVTIQQALNNCVGLQTGNVGSVNPSACATFQRAAVPQIAQQPPFGIFTFTQGTVNFARTLAQGIDYTLRYRFELEDFIEGENLGTLDWSVRGNYLIRQIDYTNVAVPTQAAHFDSTLGLPRARFLSTVNWTPVKDFSFIWTMDWQSQQEIIDETSLLANSDSRLRAFYNTDPFIEHGFTVVWSPIDEISVRAGVVNAFDEEPEVELGSTTTNDNFDLFGRRYFFGMSYKH